MFYINKIEAHNTVDYAAEELKKYLRMMMPDGGDVVISYNPSAKDGFRLGLMQSFGLDTSEVEDSKLDDYLYIDTDETGGIIAGSNMRSILLAVYEYLRQNGCIWLFPGVDGEYIPMKNIAPVKYSFKPSMRHRGWCNEGAESQQSMIDAIEFAPKVGMNTFMLEFNIPTSYYRRYYKHSDNTMYRPPEDISDTQILQWKRSCECEIAKRSLEFHDIGHGWTTEAFGIQISWSKEDAAPLPEESRPYLAFVKGARSYYNGYVSCTQFCMSQEKPRSMVAKAIVDYAQKHTNEDYLHVWLADGTKNHCECDECIKKRPTDWYMLLLNEVDREMTRRNIDTKIVFIVYCDTLWEPLYEKLENKSRFAMLFAPVYHNYTKPFDKNLKLPIKEYDHNKNLIPYDKEEYFEYYNNWRRKIFDGDSFAYEYHFWMEHMLDMGGMTIAKIVNSDVKLYEEQGLSGVIEDGSQRSFYPTGLAFYSYARTLYDTSLSYEQIRDEYFKVAFGENWKEFVDYLEKISEISDYEYMAYDLYNKGKYYNPEKEKDFKALEKVLDDGLELIKANYNLPNRVSTRSVRLLEVHNKATKYFVKGMQYKCVGDDENCSKVFDELKADIGKYEAMFEGQFDFSSLTAVLGNIVTNKAPLVRN